MKRNVEMTETTLSPEQHVGVSLLGTGPCIFAYLDGGCVRMETEFGRSPYVWRHGRWVEMVDPFSDCPS